MLSSTTKVFLKTANWAHIKKYVLHTHTHTKEEEEEEEEEEEFIASIKTHCQI